MSARILIVDDSFVMRSILTQLIKPHIDLTIAGEAIDGLDALNKMRLLQPDLILLDLEMPNMSGIDCLIQMRKENEIPVLIISALNKMSHAEIEHLENLGANGVIDKPSGSLSLNLGSRRGEKIIQEIRKALSKKAI